MRLITAVSILGCSIAAPKTSQTLRGGGKPATCEDINKVTCPDPPSQKGGDPTCMSGCRYFKNIDSCCHMCLEKDEACGESGDCCGDMKCVDANAIQGNFALPDFRCAPTLDSSDECDPTTDFCGCCKKGEECRPIFVGYACFPICDINTDPCRCGCNPAINRCIEEPGGQYGCY